MMAQKKLIFLAQHREKLMQNISESNRNISGVKLLAADEHPPWHGRQRMAATWACASGQPQWGPLVHPAAVATSQGGRFALIQQIQRFVSQRSR